MSIWTNMIIWTNILIASTPSFDNSFPFSLHQVLPSYLMASLHSDLYLCVALCFLIHHLRKSSQVHFLIRNLQTECCGTHRLYELLRPFHELQVEDVDPLGPAASPWSRPASWSHAVVASKFINTQHEAQTTKQDQKIPQLREKERSHDSAIVFWVHYTHPN